MKKLRRNTTPAIILLFAGFVFLATGLCIIDFNFLQLDDYWIGGINVVILCFVISFLLVVASLNVFIVKRIKSKNHKKRVSYISGMTLLKTSFVLFLLFICLIIVGLTTDFYASDIFGLLFLDIFEFLFYLFPLTSVLTMIASLIMFIIYFVSWLIRLRKQKLALKEIVMISNSIHP